MTRTIRFTGILMFLGAILCRFCAAQSAEDTVPEVMGELRAADRVRLQRVEELEQWRMEKERLKLLKDALEHEEQALRDRRETLLTELEALRRRRQRIAEARRRREEVYGVLEELAVRLERALARVDRQGPPGLVPPPAAAAGTTADARVHLAGEMSRLRETEKRLRTSAVDTATGRLDGELRTVHILRVGGVAAWWMTLDGARVGVVLPASREPLLRPVTAEDAADRIRRAFGILWGQELPDWVTLPLGGAE
jgi:hypothetical protein